MLGFKTPLLLLNTSWRAWRCPWKKKKLNLFSQKVSTKNFSPFGPAVLPAIGNILYECLVLLFIILSSQGFVQGTCLDSRRQRMYCSLLNFARCSPPLSFFIDFGLTSLSLRSPVVRSHFPWTKNKDLSNQTLNYSLKTSYILMRASL